ncbi:ABC transporter permease [Planctomycetota bacterium]
MRTVYNIFILSKREFFSTLFAPTAFIIVAVFLGVFGYLFHSVLRQTEQASLRYVFGTMSMVLVFVIPIITMRSFAEERKTSTLESVLTCPVAEFQLVSAKFIGCMSFYIFLLAPTAIYIYQLMRWGAQPNMPELLMGYGGMILLGAVYTSFGILCSSLVRDQVIAAFIACILLLSLNMIGMSAQTVKNEWVNVLYFMTLGTHLQIFFRGILDLRGVVYFLSMITAFFYFTVKIVEARKWR